MAETIKDGSTGNIAKVSRNRLHVDSISKTSSEHENEVGNAYNINTGTINLTSASQSAVLYLKNNEDSDLVIKKIFYIVGTSTGGSGDMTITAIRNPTAGTIVSGASAVDININRNFGSSQVLSVDVFKGAEANTFTDGTDAIGTIQSDNFINALIPGTIILPKGSSFGVNITPPTGNTSLNIQLALEVNLNTEE